MTKLNSQTKMTKSINKKMTISNLEGRRKLMTIESQTYKTYSNHQISISLYKRSTSLAFKSPHRVISAVSMRVTLMPE